MQWTYYPAVCQEKDTSSYLCHGSFLSLMVVQGSWNNQEKSNFRSLDLTKKPQNKHLLCPKTFLFILNILGFLPSVE